MIKGAVFETAEWKDSDYRARAQCTCTCIIQLQPCALPLSGVAAFNSMELQRCRPITSSVFESFIDGQPLLVSLQPRPIYCSTVCAKMGSSCLEFRLELS
jgi:hypothetical protein